MNRKGCGSSGRFLINREIIDWLLVTRQWLSAVVPKSYTLYKTTLKRTMMSSDSRYERLLKFILVGDSDTGKSCLLHFFLEKQCRKIISLSQYQHYNKTQRFCSQETLFSYCRRRVRVQHYQRRRRTGQASALGHGRYKFRFPEAIWP